MRGGGGFKKTSQGKEGKKKDPILFFSRYRIYVWKLPS